LDVGSGVKDWRMASKAEAFKVCQAGMDAFSNDAVKQLKLLIIPSSGGISLKDGVWLHLGTTARAVFYKERTVNATSAAQV
jgi:hypothetical protein